MPYFTKRKKTINDPRPQTKRWRRPEQVSIYLAQIRGTDIFKIGYTSQPVESRIRAIRFYMSDIVLIDSVIADFKYEKHFHDLFKEKNVDVLGRKEYFRLNEEDLSIINVFFNQYK